MTRTSLCSAATPVLIGLIFLCFSPQASRAHGGGTGDHLVIGYYHGHNAGLDGPADPPLPPTLLVDTHPWELAAVFYDLRPLHSVFLQGWNSNLPGFEPLEPADQEFAGHGFFSWLADDYPGGPVDVRLHLDHLDTGLQVLNPAMLQPHPFPLTLGSSAFHLHSVFFVDQSRNARIGDVYTATFHLSDANGSPLDSEPFTVQFRVVPEPASLCALPIVALALSTRRAQRSRPRAFGR